MSTNLTSTKLRVFVLLLSWILFRSVTSGQSVAQTHEKVPSIITSTIERLRAAGVNAQNASQMNVKHRFESPLTRFDEQGRFGLILNVTDVSPGLVSKLSAIGGDIVMALPYSKLISVYVPIDKVEDVASLDEVLSVSPITHAMKNTGSVTSEGDSIHHAFNVRTDLNATGDSIKVGVISDGCVSFPASRASGDLPANFGMANFFFGNGNKTGSGDEGTAMMEIVHDLAPKASLYFYGAAHDPAGYVAMVDAIYRLVREKGCRIIVDDLFFADQPMFEDATNATRSYIAAAAKWAVDTGVVYISAAGNFARGGPGNPTDRSHYQATYQDINPAPRVPPFCVKPLPNGPIPVGIAPAPPFDNLHNFDNSGGFDPGLQVTIPRYTGMGEPPHLTVVLEWNDRWGDQGGGAPEDYDLYLYDANLVNLLAWSTNFQTGMPNQNPYEILQFTNSDTVPKITNIVINHCGLGVQPRLLGVYIMGCQEVEYHTAANSIWGQPGVPGVITVGGVPYYSTNLIEDYSSRGNYDVYFPAYQSRSKPDVVAIDGGLITGAGGFGNPDGGNMRFYGTSASAPHVAGMAALLLSSSPAMTPAQVRAKFHRTAIDLGPAGFDATFGYGFLDIERTMLELNAANGASGPYARSNAVNIPMFFATNDGYAVSNVSVTGGANQPGTVSSTVTVTAGSPYSSAGVMELGCPTVKRWLQLTKTGGANGQFNAQLTAYLGESERNAAGVTANNMRIIHWNGAFFDILPEASAPIQVGNTWKVSASYSNASFSPFFVGDLVRGVSVASMSSNGGLSNETVPVTFSVRNTGNGWDTLSLQARDTKGWALSIASSALSLTANQKVSDDVSVTIGTSDSIGSIDTVWLVATSASDPSLIDSAWTTVTKTNSEVTVLYGMSDGWNMVSLPQTTTDRRASTIFPSAVSSAFRYNGGYVPKDSLSFGEGYWMKFSGSQTVSLSGFPRHEDTIDVSNKWNLIGSISDDVDVDSIVEIPGGIVVSHYFEFNGGYQVADSISPARAYWVKTSQAGKLVLKKSAGTVNTLKIIRQTKPFDGLNSLVITDADHHSQTLYFGNGETTASLLPYSELPPIPLQGIFDVRFGTQRFIEGIMTKPEKTAVPIEIQTSAYPVTIEWNLKVDGMQYWITDGIRTKKYLDSHSGQIQVVTASTLSLGGQSYKDREIPEEFALDQNYPNPFNPLTIISYSLPTSERVTLRVYNSLGEEVATLIDQLADAGYKSVVFDGSHFASGIYVYRLVAGSFVSVKKMVLIK